MPRQDQVTVAVERCRVVWAFSEVPGGRVAEMAAELEGHLRERLDDGGSIEEVIGDDLSAFAAQWADAAQPPNSALRVFLRWAILPVTATAAYFVGQHLVALARGEGMNLTLEPTSFWMLAIVVLGCLAIVPFGALRRLFVNVLLARSIFRVFVAGSLLGLGVILAFVAASFIGKSLLGRLAGDYTVHWPWPLSVGLLIVAIALSWLDARTRGVGAGSVAS